MIKRVNCLYLSNALKMKLTTVGFTFVGVYITFVMAKPLNVDVPISPYLRLVATAEKSFFADKTSRSWTEAGEYCTSLGMKLAEITSKSQFDALNAAYASDFEAGHWIAGRDAHLNRQFSWDSTGEPISNEYFRVKNWAGGQYETCLFYFSSPNYSSEVYFCPCRSSDVYVLCST